MKRIMTTALLATAGLYMNTVFATQFVEANENVVHDVNISDSQLTRISIDGGRAVHLRGLHGELETENNDELGEIYVTPLVKNKIISVFVTSEKGKNYALNLHQVKAVADSIVIKEGTVDNDMARREEAVLKEHKRNVAHSSEPYMTIIKRFFYGMSSGQPSDDITCSVSGEEVPLWKESILVRKRICSSYDIKGQDFELTNTSNETMVIEEQEFFKKDVVAVAIKQHTLLPGESTQIIVATGGQ